MDALIVSLQSVWNDSGFEGLTSGNVIMLIVGLVLLYLAIGKGFEPLLLANIAFRLLSWERHPVSTHRPACVRSASDPGNVCQPFQSNDQQCFPVFLIALSEFSGTVSVAQHSVCLSRWHLLPLQYLALFPTDTDDADCIYE